MSGPFDARLGPIDVRFEVIDGQLPSPTPGGTGPAKLSIRDNETRKVYRDQPVLVSDSEELSIGSLYVTGHFGLGADQDLLTIFSDGFEADLDYPLGKPIKGGLKNPLI